MKNKNDFCVLIYVIILIINYNFILIIKIIFIFYIKPSPKNEFYYNNNYHLTNYIFIIKNIMFFN